MQRRPLDPVPSQQPHIDLPQASIDHALELVGAVRDYDAEAVARVLGDAGHDGGIHAVCVALAAMVDDAKTPLELFAWCAGESYEGSVHAWRQNLTDQECRDYHAEHFQGHRAPEVVDGEREYQKRRTARNRRRRTAQTHADDERRTA